MRRASSVTGMDLTIHSSFLPHDGADAALATGGDSVSPCLTA